MGLTSDPCRGRPRIRPGGSRPRAGRCGAARAAAAAGAAVERPSGRYTAPIPQEYRSSPRWVPVLILTLFGLGLICIMLNYLGLLPGGASNVYLFVGLGCIVAGFIAATRYH